MSHQVGRLKYRYHLHVKQSYMIFCNLPFDMYQCINSLQDNISQKETIKVWFSFGAVCVNNEFNDKPNLRKP